MLDNGAIYMMDIQNFIGQSSTEADRQRKYYRRIQDEKKLSGSQVPEALIPEMQEPEQEKPPVEKPPKPKKATVKKEDTMQLYERLAPDYALGGEIREKMREWSLVRKAVRNSGYHSVEEFEKLPEACQRAVGSAANLKEWALMDSERVETVEQSHFIRNYRTTVQRISEEKKLPESIRLLIASMRDNALELEKKEQPVLEVKKQEEEKTDPEPGMSEETRAKFQQVMRSLQGKM